MLDVPLELVESRAFRDLDAELPEGLGDGQDDTLGPPRSAWCARTACVHDVRLVADNPSRTFRPSSRSLCLTRFCAANVAA